jgi:hypothetical protein
MVFATNADAEFSLGEVACPWHLQSKQDATSGAPHRIKVHWSKNESLVSDDNLAGFTKTEDIETFDVAHNPDPATIWIYE